MNDPNGFSAYGGASTNNLLLKNQLETTLKTLKQDLIELINNNYGDFIKLSTNLKGTDDFIEAIRVPLHVIQSEASNNLEMLQLQISELEKTLGERDIVTKTYKLLLDLCVHGSESFEKIAKMLKPILDIDHTKFASIEDDVGLPPSVIERAAVELGQLLYQLNQNKVPCKYLTELSAKVTELESKLVRYLLFVLERELRRRSYDKNALRHCFHTLAILESIDKAIVLFSKAKVDSYFTNFASLNSPATPKGSESKIDYSALKETIQKDWIPAALMAKSVMKSFTSKDFHGSFFLNAIAFPVLKHLSSIVTVNLTVPVAFHESYTSLTEFLYFLESNCVKLNDVNGEDELHMLLQSDYYTNLKAKFSMTVYYQLIMKDTLSKYEAALSESGGVDSLVNIAVSLFEESVFYIPQLNARFFRLFLQLISFYKKNINTKIEQLSQKFSGSSDQELVSVSNRGLEVSKNSYLYAELVRKAFVDKILPSKYPSELQEKVKNAVLQNLKSLEDLVESRILGDLWPQLMRILAVDHCILKYVPMIIVQYRGTNREVPSKPSFYVGLCFKHLSDQLNSDSFTSLFYKYDLEKVLSSLLVSVTQAFIKCAEETLTSMKTTQELLKKFQTGSSASFSGAGGAARLTDDDKIRLQLWLDVKEYVEETKRVLKLLEKFEGDSKPSESLLAELENLKKISFYDTSNLKE